MGTVRERKEAERVRKLDYVQEQVASGSLVIRQMTTQERERFPAKPSTSKRRRAYGG